METLRVLESTKQRQKICGNSMCSHFIFPLVLFLFLLVILFRLVFLPSQRARFLSCLPVKKDAHNHNTTLCVVAMVMFFDN